MRLAPHPDGMKKGSSWEGFARPHPPTGGGVGKPGFPTPLLEGCARPKPPAGGGMGTPGVPMPLRGGGVGTPGVPTPSSRAYVHVSLTSCSVNTSTLRPLMPEGVSCTVVVEMGGIEPPSRKLNRRYATGLARCLRSPAATQRARRPLGKPADLFPRLAGGHLRSTRLADA